LLAGRLAELSKSTQPRRAELLRQLVGKSRAEELPSRFQETVAALSEKRLTDAVEKQAELEAQLLAMLELLLQEDRDRQLESEQKRISRYLAELNKLIRQQRGIKARTAGGDSDQQLSEEQQRTANATGQLGEQIAKTEGAKSPPSQADSDGKSDSPSGKPSKGSSPPSGQPSDKQSKPSESSGSPSGDSNSDSSQQQSQQPSERAVERLQQAQQRMQQAQQRLRDAERNQAVEEQEKALRELEQAKAELEKILRQLREEEMERLLVLLEARLRKMLDLQNAVLEQTVKLDASQGKTPQHELEIASVTLSRKENQIVSEADRALLLMREDGSSVAFPEALQQAREDMVTVAGRLQAVKPDEVTQGLEEDIIVTLEETLAALQKALQKLRDQQASQQQGSGQPGEQPLVDQLAELRMIRALQMRVNRRTQFYSARIEGNQTTDDLLDLLDKLAERQEHLYKATRDLHTGANQ
jgi:hypothetical protein